MIEKILINAVHMSQNTAEVYLIYVIIISKIIQNQIYKAKDNHTKRGIHTGNSLA